MISIKRQLKTLGIQKTHIKKSDKLIIKYRNNDEYNSIIFVLYRCKNIKKNHDEIHIKKV